MHVEGKRSGLKYYYGSRVKEYLVKEFTITMPSGA